LAACSGSTNNSGNAGSDVATRAASAPAAGGSPPRPPTLPGSPGARTATAAAAPSQTPKKGGTLTSAQVTDINLSSGYPFAILSQDALLHAAVHEPLIRYRTSLTPEPVLAERFDLNGDRTVATITLRQGATFH